MKKEKQAARSLSLRAKRIVAICTALGVVLAAGVVLLVSGVLGGDRQSPALDLELEKLSAFWPSAFTAEDYEEPPFEDDASRTNNAFNVRDFGPQGTNGWFYRYGESKRPQRSRQIEFFDGEKYFQPGANGLEIKASFLHTSEAASPILEWRAAEDGKVDISLTYVKNVNGDANPGYPDGVQLMIYKGSELLKLENVDISVSEELLAQMEILDLELKELESLYFVVDPRANNAFDGGSLYIDIHEAGSQGGEVAVDTDRQDNNANNQADFGTQGEKGWSYLYGTRPGDCKPVSHEADGAFINSSSPNLTISQGFIHPAINHNAVLCWAPAVAGDIDLRVKYSKFEQHDGNPDFPDGVKIRIYKNDELLHEEHVDAPAEGENKISFRAPRLSVSPTDRLYFMVDAEGNASYDGGAFDITIIDIRGAQDESAVTVPGQDTRQNVANVGTDFGPQGSNGWIFQSGWEDDPFHAYNMTDFDKAEDRYMEPSYLEIKRDYVNPGEHGRSAIIKWRVAQTGTVSVKAAYTKLKNEDANPAWPDGTRVSLYYNNTLLAQQSFAPEVNAEITKRLDVASLQVEQGAYITMVINGLDNIAYDGGKYEFSISSLSGLVGLSERSVAPRYSTGTNFASTLDDFGLQGQNGWYYQYCFDPDPMGAVNVERMEGGDKYVTDDGIEIKKDYIVPAANGKCAVVKWVAAESGRVNVDLEYTKLKNEDANPAWPDGVTVYLMKNGVVLRKAEFAPLTNMEITKSLSLMGLDVQKGDCISMVVDPGKNAAYDGGKYLFVIEDANKTPSVKLGNNDNNSSLGDLSSVDQGSDGWWFLEGSSPADAKVLTKRTADGMGYTSRRTEGLEMKNGYVHTGAARDPIYLWVVGQDGRIDVSGSYVKFGQEDANPDWPDGVTLVIRLNDQVLLRQKVKVLRGDGNNSTASFGFDKLQVKRGDKLSFQICADSNYAWDGGQLSVVIEESYTLNRTPGDDNNSILANLSSMEQGTDGWWFLEGTSLSNAKLLTKLSDDKSAYVSLRDSGLEMKRDYVHPGAVQNPIYQWVVKDSGKLDIKGSYVKFGHNDGNPDWPDGVTLIISQNDKELFRKDVKALQGDGNDNSVDFSFSQLKVQAGDIFSFQIAPKGNNAWDAGRLSVIIGDENAAKPPIDEVTPDPNRTNQTNLKDSFSSKQGNDGWYYGSCEWDSKGFTMLPYDAENQRYYLGGKPELKADFVEPGNGKNAAYKWIVAQDGKIQVTGEYVKFANSSDPNANGTCVRIFLNGVERKWMGSNTMGNFADERVERFDELYEVHAGDELIFAVNPEGNDSWDGGRLSVDIKPVQSQDPDPDPEPEPEPQPEPDPDRTNHTVLKDDFTDTQGKNGWYYGACEWNGAGFNVLPFRDGAYRGESGKPELKADYVEPGAGKNAAYKWVAAQDGTVSVIGEYVKFVNTDDPSANGTCMRIFVNGKEHKWYGGVTQGQVAQEQSLLIDETLELKAGDEIMFAIDPDGNDAYDGGRLSVEISPKSAEPEPGTDKTALAQAIEAAKALRAADYTEESWSKLLSALNEAQAIYDKAEATQAEIDAAAQALNQAVAALEAKPQEPARTNHTVLKDDFTDTQGKNGWYYGACDWNGANFAELPFRDGAYRGENGKPELKADYVEPGDGRNAAYKWVAAQDGTVSITGEYVKFVNTGDPSANGTCMRIFVNGKEHKWYGGVTQGQVAQEQSLLIDETLELKAGDEIMFAIDPDGNDAYDGGRLSVEISPKSAEPEPEPETDKTALAQAIEAAKALQEEDYTQESWAKLLAALNEAQAIYDKAEATQAEIDAAAQALNQAVAALEAKPQEPARTNHTVLKDDFTDTQGKNGWYFGACDWNGANFAELPFRDGAYRGENGKPELKADYVEPGDGRNAAYKWIAAADGSIRIQGEYVKFVNTDDPSANGTCMRIFVNGKEHKWYGGVTQGQVAQEQSLLIDETLELKAGDEIMFAIDPDGNDAYDGGRLSVEISPV